MVKKFLSIFMAAGILLAGLGLNADAIAAPEHRTKHSQHRVIKHKQQKHKRTVVKKKHKDDHKFFKKHQKHKNIKKDKKHSKFFFKKKHHKQVKNKKKEFKFKKHHKPQKKVQKNKNQKHPKHGFFHRVFRRK